MGGHARILVVDDDESIRKVLAAILKEKGYNVDTAENGKEAIEKASTEVYDLALLDIRLPDVEGTKLLTSMKQNSPNTVNIILTGYPSLQNAIEAVNEGADAYILKPVKMDRLLAAINAHLERQHESKRYGEKKVAQFIETQVKELLEEKPAIHKKTC